MDPVRTCQILFVLYIGLFAASVVLNNLTDYGTNHRFVQHVMRMDTVFGDCKLKWRRVDSGPAHHGFYILIIALEALTAVLCLWGAWDLWQARSASIEAFQQAKAVAFWGLGLGFTIWFAIFMIGAGQWWASWQSKEYNGQDAAFRFYMPIAVVFLILMQRA
jgi:predicted small integral membrane protein